MDEWWTYRPSDFLLFSRETYYALFEQYNTSVWPLHLVAVVLAVAILRLRAGGIPWASRVIAAVLALQWAWVAWAPGSACMPTCGAEAREGVRP